MFALGHVAGELGHPVGLGHRHLEDPLEARLKRGQQCVRPAYQTPGRTAQPQPVLLHVAGQNVQRAGVREEEVEPLALQPLHNRRQMTRRHVIRGQIGLPPDPVASPERRPLLPGRNGHPRAERQVPVAGPQAEPRSMPPPDRPLKRPCLSRTPDLQRRSRRSAGQRTQQSSPARFRRDELRPVFADDLLGENGKPGEIRLRPDVLRPHAATVKPSAVKGNAAVCVLHERAKPFVLICLDPLARPPLTLLQPAQVLPEMPVVALPSILRPDGRTRQVLNPDRRPFVPPAGQRHLETRRSSSRKPLTGQPEHAQTQRPRPAGRVSLRHEAVPHQVDSLRPQQVE